MNTKLILAIKNNPVKFGRLFGFNLLTDLHNEWLKLMLFEKNDFTLLGSRGSYKTTCLSIAIALLMVLYPDRNIIFIRKTDDDIKEIIRQVSRILKSDEMAYIVQQLYNVTLILTTDSAYEIDTNLNAGTRGTSQLIGIGIKSSMTGKHAYYVFTDDIVNVRDRISRAEREQTKIQYQELQNIKNRDGRIFNTGTIWHKLDATNTLMTNVHRYDCYEMIRQKIISKEQLSKLRSSMSAALFAANYELKLIADTDALFTAPNFETDRTKIYNGLAHIDAAYGGGDYTAYTIMKKDNFGGIIAYGKIWSKHVDDCIAELKLLHKEYRAGSISCETNADKGYLARELEKAGLYVETYHESTNKYIKIASYLKKNWDNIKWIEETDAEYLQQILDYTEYAEHDDAPDSAASCIRRLTERPEAVTDNYLAGGI